MGYDMMQAASFGIGLLNSFQTYQDQSAQVYAQYDNAQRQAAVNNGLAYNSFLHLNEQQQLKTKQLALDKFDLSRRVRAAKASEKARTATGGGGASGGSVDARLRNIGRQGAEAISRKDTNFKILLTDFAMRRKNVSLDLLSKNNQAFSGLSTAPSATGLVTGAVGLGIDKYLDVGYYKGADGSIKSRNLFGV